MNHSLIKKYAVTVVVSVFAVLSCKALSPEKLRFKPLTEEDGLTNSYIYCIGQDGKGFIWIGTENGLFRYDGHRFRHYLNFPGDSSSINSNVVFKIFTDSRKNLWIGTFMGLMRYDEKKDGFHDSNCIPDTGPVSLCQYIP